MRKVIMMSAAMLGLAGAANAQTATAAAPVAAPAAPAATAPVHPHRVPMHHRAPRHAATPAAATGDIRPGHEPGVGDSFPASDKASNITAGDSRSVIAPRLPAPAGGPNGSAGSFLADAQRALNAGQTGRAQEALERAQTAMLQRSVPAGQADTPDQSPDVMQVSAARDALAHRDLPGAKRAIAAAMSAGR
jgi:hypothetical protein